MPNEKIARLAWYEQRQVVETIFFQRMEELESELPTLLIEKILEEIKNWRSIFPKNGISPSAYFLAVSNLAKAALRTGMETLAADLLKINEEFIQDLKAESHFSLAALDGEIQFFLHFFMQGECSASAFVNNIVFYNKIFATAVLQNALNNVIFYLKVHAFSALAIAELEQAILTMPVAVVTDNLILETNDFIPEKKSTVSSVSVYPQLNKWMAVSMAASLLVPTAALETKFKEEEDAIPVTNLGMEKLIEEISVGAKQAYVENAKEKSKGKFDSFVANSVDFIKKNIEQALQLNEELFNLGLYENIIKNYQSVLENVPDHAALRSTLAKLHTKLALAELANNQIDRAMAFHKQAVAYEPKNPEVYFLFGTELYANQPESNESLAPLAKAYQLNPKNRPYLEAYVQQLMRKDINKALQLWDKGVPVAERTTDFYLKKFNWSNAAGHFDAQTLDELKNRKVKVNGLYLGALRSLYQAENVLAQEQLTQYISKHSPDSLDMGFYNVETQAIKFAQEQGHKTQAAVNKAIFEYDIYEKSFLMGFSTAPQDKLIKEYQQLRYITVGGYNQRDKLRDNKALAHYFRLLAEVEVDLYNRDFAIDSITKAKMLEPDNPLNFEIAAGYESKSGHYDKALRDYIKSFQLYKDQLENNINTADKLNKIVKSIQTILKKIPLTTQAHQTVEKLLQFPTPAKTEIPSVYLWSGFSLFMIFVGLYAYVQNKGFNNALQKQIATLNNLFESLGGEWQVLKERWWRPSFLVVTLTFSITGKLKKLLDVATLEESAYLAMENDFLALLIASLKALYGEKVLITFSNDKTSIVWAPLPRHDVYLPSQEVLQITKDNINHIIRHYKVIAKTMEYVPKITDFLVNKLEWELKDRRLGIKKFTLRSSCVLRGYRISLKEKEQIYTDIVAENLRIYFENENNGLHDLLNKNNAADKSAEEKALALEELLQKIKDNIEWQVVKPFLTSDYEENKNNLNRLHKKLTELNVDLNQHLKKLDSAKLKKIRETLLLNINSENKKIKGFVVKLGYDSADKENDKTCIPSGKLKSYEDFKIKYAALNKAITELKLDLSLQTELDFKNETCATFAKSKEQINKFQGLVDQLEDLNSSLRSQEENYAQEMYVVLDIYETIEKKNKLNPITNQAANDDAASQDEDELESSSTSDEPIIAIEQVSNIPAIQQQISPSVSPKINWENKPEAPSWQANAKVYGCIHEEKQQWFAEEPSDKHCDHILAVLGMTRKAFGEKLLTITDVNEQHYLVEDIKALFSLGKYHEFIKNKEWLSFYEIFLTNSASPSMAKQLTEFCSLEASYQTYASIFKENYEIEMGLGWRTILLIAKLENLEVFVWGLKPASVAELELLGCNKSSKAEKSIHLLFKNFEQFSFLHPDVQRIAPHATSENKKEEEKPVLLLNAKSQFFKNPPLTPQLTPQQHAKGIAKEALKLMQYFNDANEKKAGFNLGVVQDSKVYVDICHFRLLRFNRALFQWIKEKTFAYVATNMIHCLYAADDQLQPAKEAIGEMSLYIKDNFLNHLMPANEVDLPEDPLSYLKQCDKKAYERAADYLRQSVATAELSGYFKDLWEEKQPVPLLPPEAFLKIKEQLDKIKEHLENAKGHTALLDACAMRIVNVGEIWSGLQKQFVKVNFKIEKNSVTPEEWKEKLRLAALNLKQQLGLSDDLFVFLSRCLKYRNTFGHHFDDGSEPNGSFSKFVEQAIQQNFTPELDNVINTADLEPAKLVFCSAIPQVG